MLPGLEMIACPNLAVSPEVMHHIVQVESSANPYAIGVVGGQLIRQPSNLGEALATVQMLDAKGYNYSLGLSQVNRANLGRYGLDSYEKAFDRCANLSAGAHILADCYKSAGGDWGKAFSCYYSGNFTTGFREGYVQKVFASMNGGSDQIVMQPQQAIALKSATETQISRAARAFPTTYAQGSAGYRVELRSLAIDKTASATVAAFAAAVASNSLPEPSAAPKDLAGIKVTGADSGDNLISKSAASGPLPTSTDPTLLLASSSAVSSAESNDVFVPQVRGPNDVASEVTAPKRVSSATDSEGVSKAADTSGDQPDAAFVF